MQKILKVSLPAITLCVGLLGGTPAEINYQGRLTDVDGNPLSGNRDITVKLYDAASGGTELYNEDIGTVTVDPLGVYSFQFGADGTNTSVETSSGLVGGGNPSVGGVINGDGTITSTIVRTLDHQPATVLSISDGFTPATFSVEITAGVITDVTVLNPGNGMVSSTYPEAPISISGDGTGATIDATFFENSVLDVTVTNGGSGYTTAEVVLVQHGITSTEVSGRDVTVTYTYPEYGGDVELGLGVTRSSIAERILNVTYNIQGLYEILLEHSDLWLELSIDGQVQSPRERILTVPFAITSRRAEENAARIEALEQQVEALTPEP